MARLCGKEPMQSWLQPGGASQMLCLTSPLMTARPPRHYTPLAAPNAKGAASTLFTSTGACKNRTERTSKPKKAGRTGVNWPGTGPQSTTWYLTEVLKPPLPTPPGSQSLMPLQGLGPNMCAVCISHHPTQKRMHELFRRP